MRHLGLLGMGLRTVCVMLAFAAAFGGARPGPASAADPPAVGAWATYEWKSALKIDIPVLVREAGPGGQAAQTAWSLARESAAPRPVFVTYGIVKGDAKSYVLQIVTRASVDGPPLSVTQVTVDRASGKAIRSLTKVPKGVVATPEDGTRPYRQAALKGSTEDVTVPAGRFSAVRVPHRNGTVWVSDQVPALGLVKASYPTGELELVKSGPAGAQDLLRS